MYCESSFVHLPTSTNFDRKSALGLWSLYSTSFTVSHMKQLPEKSGEVSSIQSSNPLVVQTGPNYLYKQAPLFPWPSTELTDKHCYLTEHMRTKHPNLRKWSVILRQKSF
jgi:hypothetical protein